MTEKFKIDDEVEWVSQSGGHSLTKVGTVVFIVPPKTRPPYLIKNPGLPRDHESYVVKVTGRGYYWPRMSVLRRAGIGR